MFLREEITLVQILQNMLSKVAMEFEQRLTTEIEQVTQIYDKFMHW